MKAKKKHAVKAATPLQDRRSIYMARYFLQQLETKIGRFHPPDQGARLQMGFRETLRELKDSEWINIKRIILKYDFPCSLFPTAYAFNLVVYDQPSFEGIHPDQLLTISCHQLPKSILEGLPKKGDIQDEILLHAISPITHRERNKELLAWCGLDPLHEPMSYSY